MCSGGEKAKATVGDGSALSLCYRKPADEAKSEPVKEDGLEERPPDL